MSKVMHLSVCSFLKARPRLVIDEGSRLSGRIADDNESIAPDTRSAVNTGSVLAAATAAETSAATRDGPGSEGTASTTAWAKATAEIAARRAAHSRWPTESS
ncbi:hypothetical protein [Bradyrhizobium sp. DOA1]|uniref:hypothetical protein n=1 Tax=Bradyrhizobium sp. DOA1 TaxID=1126616 RepID=UPI000AC5E9A9|nr:hypothetical protein [Bradyrhizobium sp. DOA1]